MRVISGKSGSEERGSEENGRRGKYKEALTLYIFFQQVPMWQNVQT